MRHITRAPLALLLLAAVVRPVCSQPPPPPQGSVNLNWNQCAGDGRVADRTFACDTNSGAETLVLSFVLQDSTRTGVAAWQAWLDITPVNSTVPPWWGFNTGQCRGAALSFPSDLSPVTQPPSVCRPWYGAELVLTAAQITADGPDRFHVALIGAVPNGVTLLGGQEYALLLIRINHAKTTGTGSCPGCQIPACLGISRLNLAYADPYRPNDYFAGAGANAVTWQDGFVAAYPTTRGGGCDAEPSLCPYQNQLFCSYPPLPARPSTWGSIKSMYH